MANTHLLIYLHHGTSAGGVGDSLQDEDAADSQKKRKRKSYKNPTPKLIDQKRQHFEKCLTARKRDHVLLNEAKEDSSFRRETWLY